MDHTEIFKKALDLEERGMEFLMITVVEKKGSGPSVAGGRMILVPGMGTFGTIGGGELEERAMNEAEQVMGTGKSALKNYLLDKEMAAPGSVTTGMLCGGEVTLFFEYFGKREEAFIFGAGHIGGELNRFLDRLGFRITVFDDREDILSGVGNSKKILFTDPAEIAGKAGSMDGAFVVIATHSHELDYQIYKIIMEKKRNPRYLGIVASRKKIGTMTERLKKDLGIISDAVNLRSPAGLDIGGRSPAEIALSISAEIQSVRYGKTGLKGLSAVFGKN